MKILFINSYYGFGSTGRICVELAQKYEAEGHTCKIAYGRQPDSTDERAVRIGSDFDINAHGMLNRITDRHALYSAKATKKFLKWADEYNPDLLWLHNLHGYYMNYETFFEWIKRRPQMKVKWTLHDCWAFTGHCSYFTVVECYKWKSHCFKCPQKNQYPKSFFRDGSKENYDRKKAAFTGVKDLIIITPSKWLAGLVSESFLKGYPVEVVYNTIDKNIFKPIQFNIKERLGIADKKMILGVASAWDERKGLNDFIELSKMLDNSYAIVLVGLTEKQIRRLLQNVKGLLRTANMAELDGLYSASDLYINPSREETFGMTTVEADLCGTKAITYKGSASEEIAQMTSSVAIEPNVNALYRAITNENEITKHYHVGVTLILLPRTSNARQLAILYSTADLFVNPTHEDNYPTVNLEAQACGTRVITYDVGGSRETLVSIG